jgi:hypothetical protein
MAAPLPSTASKARQATKGFLGPDDAALGMTLPWQAANAFMH